MNESIYLQVKCPKKRNIQNQYEVEIVQSLRPKTWDLCEIQIYDGKIIRLLSDLNPNNILRLLRIEVLNNLNLFWCQIGEILLPRGNSTGYQVNILCDIKFSSCA